MVRMSDDDEDEDEDATYEPGSLVRWAVEVDPLGNDGERLVARILGAVGGEHVAVAVDALCAVLASAFRSAPRGGRAVMVDEQLERIRVAALEGLD
jgi:hypothetical protein